MSNTFFISDLHLGHKNCLGFDNRPFKTIEEQDEEIVRRWNDRVNPEDDVYILGDIGWYSPEKVAELYSSMSGRKHLIVGNHDHKLLQSQEVENLFCEITDYKEIRKPDFADIPGLVLCHYPIPCFNNHINGWYHLYGHVHNSFEWDMMLRFRRDMLDNQHKSCSMFNTGCMVPYMDYTPRTLPEIVERTHLTRQFAATIKEEYGLDVSAGGYKLIRETLEYIAEGLEKDKPEGLPHFSEILRKYDVRV